MGTITRGAKVGGGTDFNTGQTASSTEMDVDLDTAYTEVNGNLENVNFDAAAAIVSSKVLVDGTRVTNSASISLLTGTVTLMTWDIETYDTGTYHSTGSNTGRLVAPTTGKYLISGEVIFDSDEVSAADSQRVIQIRLNAAGSGAGGTLIGQQTIGSPTLNQSYVVHTSTVYLMAATDYVELFAFQDSGETLDARLDLDPCHFSLTLLGA